MKFVVIIQSMFLYNIYNFCLSFCVYNRKTG